MGVCAQGVAEAQVSLQLLGVDNQVHVVGALRCRWATQPPAAYERRVVGLRVLVSASIDK